MARLNRLSRTWNVISTSDYVACGFYSFEYGHQFETHMGRAVCGGAYIVGRAVLNESIEGSSFHRVRINWRHPVGSEKVTSLDFTVSRASKTCHNETHRVLHTTNWLNSYGPKSASGESVNRPGAEVVDFDSSNNHGRCPQNNGRLKYDSFRALCGVGVNGGGCMRIGCRPASSDPAKRRAEEAFVKAMSNPPWSLLQRTPLLRGAQHGKRKISNRG